MVLPWADSLITWRVLLCLDPVGNSSDFFFERAIAVLLYEPTLGGSAPILEPQAQAARTLPPCFWGATP